MIEKCFVLFIHFGIITKTICILQDLSASYHDIKAFTEKLELLLWIILDIMESFHVLLHCWSKISSHLFRFIMIVKAFKVEYILIQFEFCYFFFLILLRIVNLLLKLIAFIIASSRRIVLAPFSSAQPTEIILTNSTNHMVTALIFFNWSLTFLVWAKFGISNYPV